MEQSADMNNITKSVLHDLDSDNIPNNVFKKGENIVCKEGKKKPSKTGEKKNLKQSGKPGKGIKKSSSNPSLHSQGNNSIKDFFGKGIHATALRKVNTECKCLLKDSPCKGAFNEKIKELENLIKNLDKTKERQRCSCMSEGEECFKKVKKMINKAKSESNHEARKNNKERAEEISELKEKMEDASCCLKSIEYRFDAHLDQLANMISPQEMITLPKNFKKKTKSEKISESQEGFIPLSQQLMKINHNDLTKDDLKQEVSSHKTEEKMIRRETEVPSVNKKNETKKPTTLAPENNVPDSPKQVIEELPLDLLNEDLSLITDHEEEEETNERYPIPYVLR